MTPGQVVDDVCSPGVAFVYAILDSYAGGPWSVQKKLMGRALSNPSPDFHRILGFPVNAITRSNFRNVDHEAYTSRHKNNRCFEVTLDYDIDFVGSEQTFTLNTHED